MKKLVYGFVTACLLFPFDGLQAQITVQESDFLKIFYPGDSLGVLVLQDTIVNVGQTGGPNVYDFSSLTLVSGGTVPILLGSSVADMASRFPTDTVMVQPKEHQAFTFDPTGMYDIGKVKIPNDTTVDYIHRSPKETIFRFPLSYGSGFSESITTYDTEYVKGVLTSTGAGTQNWIGAVDGYGTLKLPGGATYQCLRVTKYENPPCTTCSDDKDINFVTADGVVIIVNTNHTQADTGRITVSGFMVLKANLVTGVVRESSGPTQFVLDQNYPNPFNPATTIAFRVATRGFVTLEVFDLLGRKVATLVNGELPAGAYQKTFDAGQLPSGIYVDRLTEGNAVRTSKLLLVK